MGTFDVGKGKIVFAMVTPITLAGRRSGTLTIGIAAQVFALEPPI